MSKSLFPILSIVILTITFLTACSPATPTPAPVHVTSTPTSYGELTATQPAPDPTSQSAVIQSVLTICTGQEPKSLFLYGGAGAAASSVWDAIYDGPFDQIGFEAHPVILSNTPSLENQGIQLNPVQVVSGESMIDSTGNWNTLSAGVRYRPSQCLSDSCALTYEGTSPVMMDQLVLRFQLKPGLLWADGVPLTASDSVYSYDVARQLYPAYRHEVIARTQKYEALDETTLAWTGVPGYQHVFPEQHFFIPIPYHVWGASAARDLLTLEIATRFPLGWGPYQVEEWTPGDHITLRKNPNYYRAAEGLPRFERLVFRFVLNGQDALDALLSGECDLADRTTRLETQYNRLSSSRSNGSLKIYANHDSAIELLLFGINPIDPQKRSLFSRQEVRQAAAMCLDRTRLVQAVETDQSLPPDTFTSLSNPLGNLDVQRYENDLEKAGDILTSAGWVDADNNPATPRLSSNVPGISDGTPFSIILLTSNDDKHQTSARLITESIARCGIHVETVSQSWNELYAPGPEGPIFGRYFDLAQIAWALPFEPLCSLFTSNEIPGPFPDHPKGWGGANAAGYNSPAFDLACQAALSNLPELPESKAAHHQAQAVFADELPAIPLYYHTRWVAARPGLCGIEVTDGNNSDLWNVEEWFLGSCSD